MVFCTALYGRSDDAGPQRPQPRLRRHRRPARPAARQPRPAARPAVAGRRLADPADGARRRRSRSARTAATTARSATPSTSTSRAGSVRFRFAPGVGFVGFHRLDVEPLGPCRSRMTHTLDCRVERSMLPWTPIVLAYHDAIVEDMLDRAEEAVSGQRPRPARRPLWLRAATASTSPAQVRREPATGLVPFGGSAPRAPGQPAGGPRPVPLPHARGGRGHRRPGARRSGPGARGQAGPARRGRRRARRRGPAAVRLPRRGQARQRARRARGRGARPALPRRRRIDRRLHGLPAAARGGARRRARRGLRRARLGRTIGRPRDRDGARERARSRAADASLRPRADRDRRLLHLAAQAAGRRAGVRGRRATTASRWSSRSSRSGATASARAAWCAIPRRAGKPSRAWPSSAARSGRPCAAPPPRGCPARPATWRRSCGWRRG